MLRVPRSSLLTIEASVEPAVPPWAGRAVGMRLSAARVADAATLSAAALTAAVAAAYADLLATARHPVRFWNFLPGINEAVDSRQTRYMAFNAGRLAAFAEHPHARAATASAVGWGGRDLHVHCLSADRPGTPIDNPRQVPPHRYSARYGPRPPCFARATRVGRLLMIGGTASIRGECSVHDDLPGQVAETLTNLSAVVTAAGEAYAMTDVRVYHRPDVDPAVVRPLLPRAWPVEWVSADMCRPELLVEIEALAEVRT